MEPQLNAEVKNKPIKQKTETNLSLFSIAFFFFPNGSNHPGKAASSEADLQTIILSKPEEQPTPRSAILHGRTTAQYQWSITVLLLP